MNRDIINKLFPDAIKRMDEGKCPMCGDPIKPEEFRDELSVKEFRISGMDQKCQDKVFGANVEK